MTTDEMLKLINHPFIQGRRGPWQVGDKYTFTNAAVDSVWYIGMPVYCPAPTAIWLPPAIDDKQLERSLWGMVEGIVTLGKGLFRENYFVQVRKEENGEYKGFVSFKGNTPTEALLRAIWEQEGK